jgi:hypothetical protein
VRYRADVNPYEKLGVNRGRSRGLDEVPQRVDILGYGQRTRGRVDYVLVWGVTDALRNHPDTVATFRALEQGYVRVYVSEGGRAELWRRGR